MCIWWPWKLFWPIVTTIICMQCHNWPADENGCQMNGGYTWAWRPRDARGKAAGVQNHFPVVQSFSKPGVLSFEQHGICWKQENKRCCTESRHVGEIRLLQGKVFCRDLKTPWAGWRSVAGPRRRKRDGNDVVKGRREDEIWASFERGRGKCLGWPWWCQQQAGRRIHIHIFIFSSSSLYADIYCDGIRLNHTKPNLCPRPDRSFLGSRLIIPVPGPPGDLPLNGDFHEGHAGLMLSKKLRVSILHQVSTKQKLR